MNLFVLYIGMGSCFKYNLQGYSKTRASFEFRCLKSTMFGNTTKHMYTQQLFSFSTIAHYSNDTVES